MASCSRPGVAARRLASRRVPLPAEGLIERGLMRIDSTQRWPRLLFTETGLEALRTMMMDRRLADPARYAHIRQELGIR